LQVVFADGTRAEATLVGTDPSSDLAVIKVDLDPVALQPIALDDMSRVAVGQDVVAIGNPYGYQGTMTVGIVSGLGRTISSQTDYSIPNAIQTDAAINPGNSGGPLLNRQGKVIGVNDQIESTTGSNSGVGFAVPISIVQRVVPALIKDGRYQHAYLGISGNTYNAIWSEALDLPADAKGVYVMGVVQGAPAQQAGLRGGTQNSRVLLEIGMRGPEYLPSGGDLITAINGQAITGMDDLMTYLSEQTAPKQTAGLTVLRSGGQQISLEVELGIQPGNVRLSQTS
jgi:S1-C subfamily serine protease